MREPQHPFWRYSLRVYRRPGVEAACLALQDRCDADVNLLLFCGWIGQSGSAIDRRRLRQAIARVGAWQAEVIQPLRQARRAIKHRPPRGLEPQAGLRMRRRIAALEIDLERVEHSLLADLALGWPPPRRLDSPSQAVATNLARYLSLVAPAAQPEDLRHVAALAASCC